MTLNIKTKMKEIWHIYKIRLRIEISNQSTKEVKNPCLTLPTFKYISQYSQLMCITYVYVCNYCRYLIISPTILVNRQSLTTKAK